MIERDSTQSAPLAPPHYELLAHPLIHFPSDPPTFASCQDILDNSAELVDLFGHITVDGDSERGGLSAEAAAGFYWLTHMLEHTLRYVSQTLDDLRASQDQHHEQLKQSAFLRALQAPDETSQERLDRALEACLGISRSDINAFIRLLEFEITHRPDDRESVDQDNRSSV